MNKTNTLIHFIYCVLCFCTLNAYGQVQQDSSRKELDEVVVRAYLGEQTLFTLPASMALIDQHQLKDQPNYTLVPVMNMIPGVRAEERSPGSYRLSIRGSLLRSPFGVRNVKVYLNEFPLTDAGGNTYLNLLDINSIGSIEIIKGPDGSLFGANSGGVVLLHSENRVDSSRITAGITGGSYGLLHERVAVQEQFNKYSFSIKQSFQTSDGYRQNSALKRQYLETTHRYQYAPYGEVSLFLFYAKLHYETPAGLTLVQWEQDPKQARPATPFLPGAIQQRAAIQNQTLFGGVSNEINITRQLRNVFAVFASNTDFENPFITNYEKRDEHTYGFRTYFELKDNNKIDFHWKINLGTEWQKTPSQIRNYGNNHGMPDTLQSADQVNARQYFYFVRGAIYINHRLSIEAALSHNHYKNEYGSLNGSLQQHEFTPQFMPRLALSYLYTRNIVFRASVSKGYSVPTIQEVRASDQVINSGLRPEAGWNYEAGFRFQTNTARFWGDLSVFYYRLDQAIVRRVNDAGAEFFINAGGTNQPGLELQVNTRLIPENNFKVLRSLILRTGYTYYDFTFRQYQNTTTDYSGNRLTGVPDHVVVLGLHADLPKGFYLFTQYYYSGRIPLTDANTVYADAYHLLQLKTGWRPKFFNIQAELFAGADNLLNQKYSLGNDLNAVGGRYYNAAPLRNYYIGITIVL